MKLPAFLEGFSRKEQIRLKSGAGAIALLAGLLYWQCGVLEAEMNNLNTEITALPDVANLPQSTGSQMSKAEGKELERKRDKYRKTRGSVEKFIPKDGGKPAPITINDIVQKIPDGVDVERSERSDDTPATFMEPVVSVSDIKNPKPTWRYQALQFSFTLRCSYSSLVEFLRELDVMKSYFFVRQLSIHPPEGPAPTGKDPKYSVELTIASIYVHRNQPTYPQAVVRQ